MNKAILLTGGNMGDRFSYLAQAQDLIGQHIGHVRKASSLYETAAWGNTGQDAFLNQVLIVDTLLDPHDLLAALLHAEERLGRIRTEKWGPRLIDIDILFYNDEVIHTPSLEIPHPRIAERRFVLAPLCEVLPHYTHPVLQRTIEYLLLHTPDKLPVKKLPEI